MMKKEKKFNKAFKSGYAFKRKFIIFVLVFICVVLQIFFTIDVSVKGAKISSLEEEYELLKKENQSLEEKLIKASSLVELRKKASDMGFASHSNLYYIREDGTYALSLPR